MKIPDGWKLVPVKITSEMEDAHFAAHAKAKTVFAPTQAIWDAMLASAPTPPASDAGEVERPDLWSERHDPESVGTDPSEWSAEGRISPGEIRELTPWVALPNQWLACRVDEDGTEQSEAFPTRLEAEAWTRAALASDAGREGV